MTRIDFTTHGFATLDLSDADKRRAAIEAAEQRRAIFRRRLAFDMTIGQRYRGATLDNWQTPTEAHHAVKRQALALAADIGPAIAAGRPAIFAGYIGTGKDHLAIGLARRAVEAGYSAAWHHAAQIYTDLADCYRTDRSHAEFYARFTTPALLVISDPIDERNWTQAKADCCAKIVHRRYTARRPTWITANLDPETAGDQVAAAVGAEIWDRLRENAIVFRMYWDSYRTGATTKK